MMIKVPNTLSRHLKVKNAYKSFCNESEICFPT